MVVERVTCMIFKPGHLQELSKRQHIKHIYIYIYDSSASSLEEEFFNEALVHNINKSKEPKFSHASMAYGTLSRRKDKPNPWGLI